jgi:CHAT domain-containing protein
LISEGQMRHLGTLKSWQTFVLLLAASSAITSCTASLGRPGEEAYTQSQETSASHTETLLSLGAGGATQTMRGQVYLGKGDYHDAELDERDAIAVFDAQGYKPEDPQLGYAYRLSLTILATAYYRAGEYWKAEPLYLRVAAINQGFEENPTRLDRFASVLPSSIAFQVGTSREVSRSLGPEYIYESLGAIYVDEGRYSEAEGMFEQAERECDETGHIESYGCVGVLGSLGSFYGEQRLYSRAEPLMLRELEIDERTLGPDSKEVSTDLGRLARLFAEQLDYTKAEQYDQQALQIRDKLYGPDHYAVADTLVHVADDLRLGHRYAEAEPLYQRSIAIREKALGLDHPAVASALDGLTQNYNAEGNYAKAESPGERALTIREAKLGLAHPAVAQSLNNLAAAKAGQGDLKSARPLYERARKITLSVRRSNADLGDQAVQALLQGEDRAFPDYIKLLAHIARQPSLDSGSAPAELDAFVVAEQSRSGAAQSAIARVAALAAAHDWNTQALARRVQDLRDQHDAIAKQLDLAHADAKPDQQLIGNLQPQEQTLDGELKGANEQLLAAFPQYLELIAPEPIDAGGTQRLLHDDEALVSYFTLDDRVLIWLIRPGQSAVYRDLPIEQAELTSVIARVRASLNPSKPYDLEDAHALYESLLGPFKDQLAGVKQLILVPDDTLLTVPFASLVTDTNSAAYATLVNAYHRGLAPSQDELEHQYPQIAWVASQGYALSVLPSATSLRLLRAARMTPQAGAAIAHTEPFIGIGDPILGGKGAARGGAMIATRGADVVADLRELPSLPGTRDELISEAKALGADETASLFIQDRATKPAVMSLNQARLANTRVIAFATHALTGGELSGLTEPALVLTPPATPSDQDDGLLRMQDILSLQLTMSDWVILSACNTAAPGGTGEGLSGLTRAFFYAGAPSLLVSQWSVDDAATDQLMTYLFTAYGKGTDASRAAALHNAMLKLMTAGETDSSHAYFAHPFAWAPFIVVGEGGPATN